MIIYIFNYLLVPLHKLLHNKKVITLVIFLQLFLILAFRYDQLGVDVEGYRKYYRFYNTLPFEEIINSSRFLVSSDLVYPNESGYVLINWICGSCFDLDFHGFLVFHSFVCVGSIGLFIYKYSKDPVFSFILLLGMGIYGYFFCILRQTFAIAIIIWCVPLWNNKKYIKSLLLLCLAILFHRTAILFVLVLIFSKIKITKVSIPVVVACSLVLAFAYPIFVRILFGKILVLVGKGNYGELKGSLNTMIFIMILLAFSIFIFHKFSSKNDSMLNIMIWAFLLALPLQAFPMFTRVAQTYNMFFYSIAFPNILAKRKKSTALMIKIICFVCLFAYYMYVVYLDVWGIIPYKTQKLT